MTVTATYAVLPGFTGEVANTASVGSPTVSDPTPGDNTSVALVAVGGGGPPTQVVAAPVNALWALYALLALLLLLGGRAARTRSQR
jgi:hypothetical protein